MMQQWKKGDICYFVEGNSSVIKAKVTAVRGDFCTVKYANNGAIRLRDSKLFKTAEEAQSTITQEQSKVTPRRANPYLYNH